MEAAAAEEPAAEAPADPEAGAETPAGDSDESTPGSNA
jgi:hypothetical protein